MTKIALLTCQQFPDLIPADQKLIPLLSDIGIEASAEIWNDTKVDWTIFDALIVRNTWDYYLLEQDFASWIDTIEKLGVTTFNPISVIRKNMHKFYLKDMSEAGIRIIPSIFIHKTNPLDLPSLLPSTWEKVILKPAISAGSHQTVLFNADDVENVQQEYKNIAQDKDLIMQQFVPQIKTNGEISLIFFNKIFSHAVVKLPKDGDFRIQSQFGGKYSRYTPSQKLLEVAQSIVHFVHEDLLYARVDGILIDGAFYLMELELIEPDLYLDLVENGQKRFVDEISSLLN